MILGKEIYADDGRVMLHADVVLDNGLIQKLNQRGVPCVYIKDEESKEVEIVETIEPALKVKAIQSVKKIVDDLAPVKGKISPKNRLMLSKKTIISSRGIIHDIMDNLKQSNKALVRIVEMMGTDMHLYTHSVNVTILSLVIAMELLDSSKGQEFEKKLTAIGIGAMLHDIGKANLPPSLLNKIEPLTPDELALYRQHPMMGYELLRDNEEINNMPYSGIIKGCALMHHENLDGSGYPNGWDGTQLDDYVRIVRVADLYSNMSRTWAGMQRYSPAMALEKISSMCYSRVDAQVFKILKERLALYPEGTCVLMNTGEKGLVTKNNETNSDRPIVKIIRDVEGKPYKGFKVVDMMREMTYFIVDSVDINE